MRLVTLAFNFVLFSAMVPLTWGQQIVVNGEASAPFTLSAADLAKMDHTSAIVLENGELVNYGGVPLVDILKKAGLPLGSGVQGRELVGLVIAKGKDGKQVGFSFGELDPTVGGTAAIVADRIDGKPIEGKRGPFRLVVVTDRGNGRFIEGVQQFQVMHADK